MKAQRRFGLARSLQTALAPGHPYSKVLADAHAYNQSRTLEGPRGLADGNRILNFNIVLDLVAKVPTGDYAELGTYRGLTASLIWSKRKPGSALYCFDTFEGFDDRDLGDRDARLKLDEERNLFKNTSIDLVTKRIAGGPDPALFLRQGFFPDTFTGLEDKRFRFVHLDLDLAEPIKAGLEVFWPRMVDGGIILVHDYYSARYPMAREAMDAFFNARGITVFGLSDRLGTGMVIRQPGMPD